MKQPLVATTYGRLIKDYMLLNIFGESPLDPVGVATSLLCGFLIGLERQWNGKPAGIRTSIFICLSAFIFVSLGKFYNPSEDATRIIGQVVTGVSFLGGGVIIAREGLVQGVTSAALVWLMSAIGSLCGMGDYLEAVLISLLIICVLLSVRTLERYTDRLTRGAHQVSRKKKKEEERKRICKRNLML